MTGDLTKIRDAKIRSLVRKGPSYREQNCIDWTVNERLCREAVAEYKRRWSTREGMDVRAFNEWEIRLMNVFSEKLHHLGRSILIKEKSMSLNLRSI